MFAAAIAINAAAGYVVGRKIVAPYQSKIDKLQETELLRRKIDTAETNGFKKPFNPHCYGANAFAASLHTAGIGSS